MTRSPCLIFILAVFATLNTPASHAAIAQKPIGKVVREGSLECFSEGMKDSKGKPLTCELSSVVWVGKRLIFWNDKPLSGHDAISQRILSPVISAEIDLQTNRVSQESVQSLLAPPFQVAQKFEASTLSADRKYVIGTTAFDRETENFNSILYFPVGQPSAVKVAVPTRLSGTDPAAESSVALRPKLLSVLNNEYIKIEGLAAVPSTAGLDHSGYDKLVFGVREQGSKYDNFNYTITLVSVSYWIQNGELQIRDDFRIIYNRTAEIEKSGYPHFQSADAAPSSGAFPLGISSLEYDSSRRTFIIMTSLEKGDSAADQDAFIWTLSVDSLRNDRAAALVTDSSGLALHIYGKGEGMTLLPNDKLFVIQDADRATGLNPNYNRTELKGRKLNQSNYTVIQLSY